MKKVSICLALLMAIALCGSAFAASSVTYEGGAEKFVFLPGSAQSETDLFENFKGLLPGDTATQTITVKNNTDGNVRIYLRAEPVNEADREFLNNMTMTVECRDKEIFDASASETAQLTNNTLLGAFKSKGSTELIVTLNIPASMGNEFMGRSGIVPWTFLVEEIVVDDTPDTGDWFEAGVWGGAAALICAAIVVLMIAQKKRRAEEN